MDRARCLVVSCRVTVRHFFRYLHRRCVGNKDPFQRTSYHRSSVQPSCTCKLQSSSPPCQFRTQLIWLVFWYILPSCLADFRLVHKLSAGAKRFPQLPSTKGSSGSAENITPINL